MDQKKTRRGSRGGNNHCQSEKKVKITLIQAHEKLGHINKCTMKEISKVLGWVLSDMKTLNGAAGKAKQKSLKKVIFVEPNDEKHGYKAYLNLLMVKTNENYPTPTNPNRQFLVVGKWFQLKKWWNQHVS